MKKITLLLICFVCFKINIPAQTKFDTCQYAHSFQGEWMYANGNDTIRVFLRLQRDLYTNVKSIDDRLYGWHEYKQGNTIIESNYANRFMTIQVDTISKNSFSIGLKLSGLNCDNKKAMGSITDYSQGMETKIVTASLDITGFYLTWDQRHSEGFGQFSGATGMTLPAHFVLQKQ